MRARLLVVAVVLGSVLAGLGAGAAIAAFTARESNPQDLSAAAQPPTTSDLVAQSRSNDGGATSPQIQFGLQLANRGAAPTSLGTVTLRYWFTANGSEQLVTACYYAAFGCGNVEFGVTELPTPRVGADHYLEVSFAGGTLEGGQSASLDQLALRDQGGIPMRQDDDWSFANRSAFADNANVTVYIGGELAWGTEPGAAPLVESFELQYLNRSTDPLNNSIEPTIALNGTGNVAIDLRRVTIRYWFTKDSPSQSLLGVCDFAQIDCAKVSVGFAPVSPALPGADTYLEVRFSGGKIPVEGTSGQIQLRANKADYSNFDESNDYSWGTNIALELNPRITAYLDGELVWDAAVTEVHDDPNVGERLHWLRRNMTAWVLVLVLLLVAAAVGMSYTLGVFSDSSANPENVLSAGSMSQVNSADDRAIMAATDLVPGQQVSGAVTIRNAGDARGDFRLVVQDVADEPGPGGGLLSERLVLRVEEQGTGEEVYAGPLGDLDADLGTWAPEEERGYDFVVTFPESTANAYQRSAVTATFVWDAVQAR